MKLLANMVVPVVFLLGSIFAYMTLSGSLESDDVAHQEFITSLEGQIAKNPTKAHTRGLHVELKAQKHLQESEAQFLSAMRHFLVEGAFGLFILSLAWQFYIHRQINENS